VIALNDNKSKNHMTKFLYESICESEIPICQIEEISNGFLGTLSEFHNLIRLSYHKYKNDVDATNYLNSPELKKIVYLLYNVLMPAHDYFYTRALGAVRADNENVSFTLTVCLIIYIISSCCNIDYMGSLYSN